MSILIKGMEMPKENDYTIAIVYGDGVVTEYHEDYWIRGADGEKQLGTVVPVPEHGRLGDLDELYAHLNEWYLMNNPVFTKEERIYIRAMLLGISEAPTIIPAEED